MKFIFLISILIISGCTMQQVRQPVVETSNQITIYQNNQNGLDSIISNKALESFKNEYAAASINKAFAQSVSGAWNWKSNRTSVEHAKTSALIGCQRNNKKSEDIYPCKIIHLNDEWVE